MISSSALGAINLTMINVRDVVVTGNGGLFYINNPNIQSLNLQQINARNVSANKGGIFYI